MLDDKADLLEAISDTFVKGAPIGNLAASGVGILTMLLQIFAITLKAEIEYTPPGITAFLQFAKSCVLSGLESAFS